MRALVLILALLAGASIAAAQDFHVEASRTAIVRDTRDTGATELMRLARGERLNAVTGLQVENFYEVQLPTGGTGWVSRYVVRVNAGAAGGTVVAGEHSTTAATVAPATINTAAHLAVGRPLGYEVVENRGFVAGYDPKLKIPVWVQYRLTAANSASELVDRSDAFAEDGAVPIVSRATLGDYAAVSSDYVRGHMAPADDMRWNETAELQSNLLTNIAPQIGSAYNGSVWKRIENGVRRWVIAREDLIVITGPVFAARPAVAAIDRQPVTMRQMVYNVVGPNDVAVPTGFYKIIVDMRNPAQPDVLAFMVPHFTTTTAGEREIDQYLRSVDEIEEMTGLDFLAGLPVTVQEAIEGSAPAVPW